jgi:hypothetical protein
MLAAALTADEDEGPLGPVVAYELAELIRRFNALERRAHRPEKWDRWNMPTFLKGMKVPVRSDGEGGKRYVLIGDLKESGLLDSILDAVAIADAVDEE